MDESSDKQADQTITGGMGNAFHVIIELGESFYQLQCPICGKALFRIHTNGSGINVVNCSNCKTFLGKQLKKINEDPSLKNIH
jgi:hypothetical protein